MKRYLNQYLSIIILSISLLSSSYIVPKASAEEGIDKLMIQIQTKACQLLNQGSSIPDVISNIKPIVKRFDPDFISAYAKHAREVLNESGNDIDITTRRVIYGPIKRNCPQHLKKLIEYNKSPRSEVSPNSSGQIVDGQYVYELAASDNTEFLNVKGNKYRIFNFGDFGKISKVPLKPISELKYVRVGVLYNPNTPTYWCSDKAPYYQKPTPRKKYYCTPEGWSSSPYIAKASKANIPQPPVLPNNQKLELEPPKVIEGSNSRLPEAQDLEKLNGVPVFIIVNAKNEPLKGKDVGDSSPVAYFFLNPDDAIAQLNRIKNTNPEVGDKAKIVIRSMNDAYQTIKKNQDRKDITFQIAPSKASIDSAREILSSQGKSTNKLPDIPVFFATGNTDGTDGLLTLTQNGKQFIPYFFDLKDLQTLVNKAMQAQPNVINITKMQVTSLSQVLDLITSTKNGKPNPETQRFTFVPSRSAFEYVKQNGSSK